MIDAVELELRECEPVLRAILDGTSDAIYLKDRLGRCVFANAACARVHGCPVEEVIGKEVSQLFRREEAELMRAVDQEVLLTGQPRTVENTVKRAERTHVFQTTKSPFFCRAGYVIGVLGVSRDITDQKAQELASARLAAIVDSSADAIIGMTLDGTMISWNVAAERMFGYTRQEALGSPTRRLVPAERRRELAMFHDRLLRGERIQNHETLGHRKDGTRIAISLTLSPIQDSRGTIVGTSMIARDITAQELAARERAELLGREQAARVEAQAATQAKDDFLAVLSHELRAPLQSMLGWTQILKATDVDARMVTRGLETLERNIKLQTRLIEDLLDVSRIVTGKLHLVRQRVDLASIVAAALTSAKAAADAKSIAVDVTLDPLTGEVLGDPARLEQIVVNLLSNAVKFTPEGGTVGVRLEREGRTARITVEDTGAGIDPEFLPHVFERFRQAEGTAKRSQGGLGLGLAIVRHLVELHGGTVAAASAGRGQGSRFTVTLPLDDGEPGPASASFPE